MIRIISICNKLLHMLRNWFCKICKDTSNWINICTASKISWTQPLHIVWFNLIWEFNCNTNNGGWIMHISSHSFYNYKYLPTTYNIPSVEAVWNIGASPETSHRYWPVVVKSTLSNTTSRSVDNLAWNNTTIRNKFQGGFIGSPTFDIWR